MYRLRYRALEAGTAPRNAAVCMVLLLGSYIISGVINATTVTQPELSAPRGQTVIVSPRAIPAADDLFSAEIPDPVQEPESTVEPAGVTQKL